MPDFPIEKYGTKSAVYSVINAIRRDLQLDPHRPLDAKELFSECCPRPKIFYPNFRTNSICGILYRGENATSIALNNRRSEGQQNFDCAHEMIHYFCHDAPMHFSDAEGKIVQDSGLEYQANEGAAQLLIPDVDFIPRFFDCIKCKRNYPSFDIVSYLAQYYRVSEQVIRMRIDNLSFEMDQFRLGMSVDCLIHLSKTKLRDNNIHPTCYLALTDFNGLDQLAL